MEEKTNIEQLSEYVPPSLERTGSQSIAPLKDRHRGEVCYVVGKGPSVVDLKAHHFGPGPVLVINETIRHVQELGLPNQIYSMQKDGCVTSDPDTIPRPCDTCEQHGWKRAPVVDPYPGVAVLFSQHLSSWCLHGRKNRYVFTDAELGFEGYPMTMSVLETVPLAKHFGCQSIVMMCFDSLVNGNTDTMECIDGGAYARNYEGSRITVDVPMMQRNVEWVRPRILFMLRDIPHSFFIPNGF